MQLVVALGLAAALVASAVLKLAAPRTSRDALATFGVPERARVYIWGALIVAELALGVGVALRSDIAAWTASALLLVYAGALLGAILTGREGAPCGCFGERSRVSRWGIARTVALAAGLFALPWLPDRLSTDGWLAFGLAIALAGVAGLSVVTLSLAREVGRLRGDQLVAQAALEPAVPGAPIGAYSSLAHWFPTDRDSLAVAIFTSESCALCNALAPDLNAFAKTPDVDVLFFDDVNDATAWAEMRVPGSPYAIALDSSGVVRSKGTFSSVAQLKGILAAAERRPRVSELAPAVTDGTSRRAIFRTRRALPARRYRL
jgi:Methylamine utilisation protein MauE